MAHEWVCGGWGGGWAHEWARGWGHGWARGWVHGWWVWLHSTFETGIMGAVINAKRDRMEPR